MKILFVNPGIYAEGGAERSLLGLIQGLTESGLTTRTITFGEGSLARSLAERGHDHVVIDLGPGFPTGARFGRSLELLRAGVRAVPVLVRAARFVQQEIDRFGPDIVHTNGYRAHLATPLLRLRGARLVFSLRDLPQNRLEREAVRSAALRARALLANSGLVASAFGTPTAKTFVVENPVAQPLERNRAASRRLLGIPDKVFVIASLAHFHWWKGQLDLVEAMDLLPENAYLLLAGGDIYGPASGQYRHQVEAAAARSRARGRIRLLGRVADVSWVYAAADVVAHSSIRPEPFGRTIVEALLARRPVVASELGTPGAMLLDGQTALLYQPGDAENLCNQLERVMQSPALGRAIADAGFEWARGRFSIERHATRVREVYEAILGA
jgi:glycosyltransferase involved in cell wall biosynthesis